MRKLTGKRATVEGGVAKDPVAVDDGFGPQYHLASGVVGVAQGAIKYRWVKDSGRVVDIQGRQSGHRALDPPPELGVGRHIWIVEEAPFEVVVGREDFDTFVKGAVQV